MATDGVDDFAAIDPGSDAVRSFPGADGAGDDEVQVVRCVSCGQRWRVHNDLSGFAVTCARCCGNVEVPAVIQAVTPVRPNSSPRRRKSIDRIRSRALSPYVDPHRVASLGGDGGLPVESHVRGQRGRVGLLDDADVLIRSRWINRAMLEAVLVLAALIVPQLVVSWQDAADEQIVLTPVASVIGGLLVLCIAGFAPTYSFGGLRRFPISRILEGVGVAAVMGMVGIAWMKVVFAYEPELAGQDLLVHLVRDAGLPSVLFMVALCPAFFEEIGFRGLLQTRLTAVYGLHQGMLYTTVLFAVAHGITPALPLHIMIGGYLCWLRVRSESLWPCILVHMIYNGVLVVHAAYA